VGGRASEREQTMPDENDGAKEASRHDDPDPTRRDPTSGPEGGGPVEKEGGQFVVVGIGASAGGLEALRELIRYVPPQGIAYIVVQHLAPDHESLLTELLARNARMPVVTAADGMGLEPARVHVTPPDADLAIMNGVIRVMQPVRKRGPHLPVDHLFRSLADDQGHSAIGIVLSGTGTDGTLGLEAIKAAGGFTFVQEPSTAAYDGMPRSALESGAADYCLGPKAIAEELARLLERPRMRATARTARAPEPDSKVRGQLDKLFILIRSEFGNDLTQYKPATIDRRVERRMMFHKLERLEDYVRYVQQDRDELRALYKDILITVTSFFRDPDVFEALKTEVLARILDEKPQGQPIRVWVPGCATGEEAYSIAMCLLELCEERGRDDNIQIFGTDVDDDSIQSARRGAYPANIALDVSPERLHRFFDHKDEVFQVSRRIRDMLVFSRHNVLKDAPFSRLDLVSCRNLLIYLQPSAQKKVLRILHYALNPSGHLLLGTSETVGDAPHLFSAIDRKNKIYAKRLVGPQAMLDVGFGASPPEPTRAPAPKRPTQNLQALADRRVLELYGPPGVVVNEELEILQFRGHTGPYLDPVPGAASLDILKVARFELHVALKKVLERARSEQVRVTTDLTYPEDGKQQDLELDVVPLRDRDAKTRCFLVLFHKMPARKEVLVVAPQEGEAGELLLPLQQRIQQLERELAMTKEYLQATTEEKESTLEELKSANEELQSSNEELQSTNEELETSKEEMQSTNEELTTVNDELHSRMTELSQANDDLHNVLAGVDNAVVIVGMDLRIRRYTRAAEQLFNLIPGDLGRSITFLDSFIGTSFEPKVSSVIHSLSTLEEELLCSNQRWYALKVSPYKTLDHTIRGALVTLIDIDVRKRAIELTRDVDAYAATFLGGIGHPLVIIDRDQRVVWVNDVFLSTFQLSSEETVGNPLASVGMGQFADSGLREQLEHVFASSSILRNYELQLSDPKGGECTARVGASPIPAFTQRPLALLSIETTYRAAGGDA
jgi:two-component system, chemotaxis family, CheB/CheR fusion protein